MTDFAKKLHEVISGKFNEIGELARQADTVKQIILYFVQNRQHDGSAERNY